ncbi:hypothetical protein JOD55_000547 [Arcanobacterium pluranimalium]|uniref:hypothetical protein n=1 Tax=Arcanobacterium pluranimalium TaxID=108028 RepID=UPI0019594373|nr:hypothetical protein [Arcanobacterium pluranimalium]MBM7824720.1 hypothetical protein [Arcanobacterium pluranimalium]
MANWTLDFGDSISGLLVDGVTETPYVGATLKLTRERGIIVEVPYLIFNDNEQFKHVHPWFHDQTPPPSMQLLTNQGTVTLCGVKWSGSRISGGGGRIPLGILRPEDALFSEVDDGLQPTLRVQSLRSNIDGLHHWTGLSTVTEEIHTDSDGRCIGITNRVKSSETFEWIQGFLRAIFSAL